jgi:hypothetical protein
MFGKRERIEQWKALEEGYRNLAIDIPQLRQGLKVYEPANAHDNFIKGFVGGSMAEIMESRCQKYADMAQEKVNLLRRPLVGVVQSPDERELLAVLESTLDDYQLGTRQVERYLEERKIYVVTP